MLAARGFAGGFELFEACGVEWWLAVEVEDCLPGFVERGEVGTHAGGVGGGFHVVDGEGVEVAVGGKGRWGEEWVGVVVDGGDGGDLGGQGGVDARGRLGLCDSGNREQGRCEGVSDRIHGHWFDSTNRTTTSANSLEAYGPATYADYV